MYIVIDVGGPMKRIDQFKLIIADGRNGEKRVPEVVFVDAKPKPSASKY